VKSKCKSHIKPKSLASFSKMWTSSSLRKGGLPEKSLIGCRLCVSRITKRDLRRGVVPGQDGLRRIHRKEREVSQGNGGCLVYYCSLN